MTVVGEIIDILTYRHTYRYVGTSEGAASATRLYMHTYIYMTYLCVKYVSRPSTFIHIHFEVHTPNNRPAKLTALPHSPRTIRSINVALNRTLSTFVRCPTPQSVNVSNLLELAFSCSCQLPAVRSVCLFDTVTSIGAKSGSREKGALENRAMFCQILNSVRLGRNNVKLIAE